LLIISRESRRKTPVAVSLKGKERLFSDGAQTVVGVISFCHFQELLVHVLVESKLQLFLICTVSKSSVECWPSALPHIYVIPKQQAIS